VRWLSDNYTWSAEAPAKWLWAVTLANTTLLLAFIYEAISSEVLVSGSPLSIFLRLGIRLLPFAGIALSVTGFSLTKGVESRTSRRVAYVINGFALTFQLLIVLGLAVLWLSSAGLLKLSDMH
jgi:hypothetical protein